MNMASTLFIETRRKFSQEELNLDLLKDLPGKTISLAATVQYLDLIPKVKSFLEKLGKKVITKQGAFYEAHVLGCNSNAFDKSADTILLIADGKFHALNNAVQLEREIYVFSGRVLEKVTLDEIKTILRKKRTAVKKFLAAESVGILVSTKPGQHITPEALLGKIKKSGKNPYVFESNNINIAGFEDFPIDIWVNTACPGLSSDDSRIVNFQDILQYI